MPTAKIRRIKAQGWLEELLRLFPAGGNGISPYAWEHASRDAISIVPKKALPPPYRELLANHHHMTVTLERFYGAPLVLEVFEKRRAGDDYARKLRLRAGAGGPVVLTGIMRFFLRYVNEDVQREILAAQKPLGRILIDHGVMRRIQPVANLKVALTEPLRDVFEYRGGAKETFGRLALIFCDEEPAVELLEIASPGADREEGS